MASEHLTNAPSASMTQTAASPPGSDAPAPPTDPAASEGSAPAVPAPVGGSRRVEPTSPAFIVDTVTPEAPEIIGFSPDSGASGDGFTNSRELVLTGRAEADSTVTVRDGETVLGTAPADGSGAWRFTTGVLPEGPHSFTAVAIDAAGNAGAPSGGFAVTVDTSAPSVALLAVKNDVTGEVVAPTALTNDNTPTLSGTAEEGSSIEVILSNAGSPDIVLTPPLRGADWSVTPGAALTDGPYTVRVKPRMRPAM
jgi:hypothetical protein